MLRRLQEECKRIAKEFFARQKPIYIFEKNKLVRIRFILLSTIIYETASSARYFINRKFKKAREERRRKREGQCVVMVVRK